MNDKEINVRVTANTADLKSGMAGAPASVESATASIRSSFSRMRDDTRNALQSMRSEIANQVRGMMGPMSGMVDMLSTVKGGFVAVAAVAATVGLSRSVSEAADMTESAMDLSRALGITTNEASVMQAAMADVGASQAELEEAAKGLSRQLRTNEDEMRALGLATRDASGNLRPMTNLLTDSIQILNQYREGADRSIASQTLFGRGIDASSKLLLLNRDTLEQNRAAVEDLGLTVGENAVEAWGEFDSASDRAGLSVKAMVKAVGDSLMPVIVDLINLFNAVMPAAITVVRGALSGLTSAFLAVKNGVVVVWETINAMVITVAEPISGLAEAIWRAANGDFKGAGEAIKNVGTNISSAWDNAMQSMADSSVSTANRIKSLFVRDTGTGRGGMAGNKTVGGEQEKSVVARLKDYETEQIKEAFEVQKKIYRDAVNAIDKIEKDRIAMAERNKKRLVDLLAPETKKLDLKADDPGERAANQSEARTNLLSMIAQAKAALSNKEFDKAIEIGEKASALIVELKDAGAQATSVLAVQLRDVAAIQDEASAGQAQAGKAKADEAKNTLDEIKNQMEALKKVEVGIDQVQAENALLEWSRKAQAVLDAHPLKQAISMASAAALGVSTSAGASMTIPSAAGGWDIPRGMNPLTQLHEREMVLPANIADVVRGASGGGANNGVTLNLTLPGVGTFETHASPRVAEQLRSALSMESLKYGGRTR